MFFCIFESLKCENTEILYSWMLEEHSCLISTSKEHCCATLTTLYWIKVYVSTTKTFIKVIQHSVEFNIPSCRAQSSLHIGENQKSILFFYPKLWNLENSENFKS